MDAKLMVKGVLVGRVRKADKANKDGRIPTYVSLDYMGGSFDVSCFAPVPVPEVGKTIDVVISGRLSKFRAQGKDGSSGWERPHFSDFELAGSTPSKG